MRLILVITMAVLTISCCAQAQSKVEVFSGQSVTSELTTLVQAGKSSGGGGATLGDYRSHAVKLSVRTASGGAESHAHYDDIFLVTEGKADLVTGGSVENAKTDSDGETKGSSIQNGTTQTIAKGDVVHIPAGTPHQLILAPGSIYSSIVIKVKDVSDQH